MSTTRAFAYNPAPNPPIPNTEQIGDLVYATERERFDLNYGGVRWWMGPDEDLGFVIATSISSDDQPTEPGINPPFGDVGFWRTNGFNDSDLISLTQVISREYGDPQTFATANDAKLWLNNNGFWTSYTSVTPTPTPTPSPTPTPIEELIDPIITENGEYIEVGEDFYLMY